MGKLIRAVLRGQDDGNIIPLPDHHAKELQVPENIRLIPQPPYSPELNPVEHLWEHLREKQFPNLACSSLDEVIDKVCEGLTQLEAEPKRLRCMTYFPHFRNTS